MAKDLIHDNVKQALLNDGWTILDEHVRLDFGRYKLFADLSIERTLAVERDGRKILVEIKSFSERSLMRALQQAIGQYRMYVDVVELTHLEYEVYLAVSKDVYDEFLSDNVIQQLIQRNGIQLIVINLEHERVIQWIN
ncbi:MAG: element excision factor XisH family protein [Chloroflexota bacterium]